MDEHEIKPGAEGTVSFWELAGIPQYKMLEGETPGQFLARINDPTKWIYGSELRDQLLLKSPHLLPRFSALSRKAFMHYGGGKYNPHEVTYEDELFMRCTIGNFISYKISGRVNYDWELIDNFLMKIVSDVFDLNLPYDIQKIEQGFAPEFRSPFDDINEEYILN